MIRLSIIVPIYNVEPYIEECIRSLYCQDIPMTDYEVICIDDCSPDKSASIIEELQKEYSTLHLIRHERNKKLGGARNTGIRAAKGKYILFVDSDDMLKPDCLKQLIGEMETGQDDFIHFNYVKLFSDGTLDKEPHFAIDAQQRTGADLFFSEKLNWREQISACRKMYRMGFIKANNLYFAEDTMYEDNDYAMRVAAAAKKCHHLDVVPYIYRQVATSTIHETISAARLQYWQATWLHMVALLDTIAKQDERFRELINFYMRYDLWDVLNNMYKLPKEQRIAVKKNLSVSEWWKYIRFLPPKRRVEYIYKLLKA
ncbi:MAG: glycosyltransferase family 2 protein [Paludibacteraceae bacterium]|nr:glycosyltransferase family 2 protein [Paludibacteraceae bacterium]